MSIVEHTSKLPAEPEFARRAAKAWVRAADAGLIDAGELVWLLSHLPSSTLLPTQTGPHYPAIP